MQLVTPWKLKYSFTSRPAHHEHRNHDFHYSSSYSSSFLKTGLILSGRTRAGAELEFLCTISGHSADLLEDIQQQQLYQDCMVRKARDNELAPRFLGLETTAGN